MERGSGLGRGLASVPENPFGGNPNGQTRPVLPSILRIRLLRVSDMVAVGCPDYVMHAVVDGLGGFQSVAGKSFFTVTRKYAELSFRIEMEYASSLIFGNVDGAFTVKGHPKGVGRLGGIQYDLQGRFCLQNDRGEDANGRGVNSFHGVVGTF